MSKRAPSESTKASAEHRAGFVSLIGRPNAGKSTLLNRLVGQKLAIVSSRPQTTRNRITGILTRPDAQAVFVDTPGLHVGGGKLGAFMQQTARRAMEDVDVVCLVVDATDRTGPDDLVLEPLRAYGGPAVCALNKTDIVAPKAALLPLLDRWRTAHDFQALVPISATDGTNCDRLLDLLLAALPDPPGPVSARRHQRPARDVLGGRGDPRADLPLHAPGGPVRDGGPGGRAEGADGAGAPRTSGRRSSWSRNRRRAS